MIQLALSSLLLLAVFFGFRALTQAPASPLGERLRRPLIGVGLVAFLILASRLGGIFTLFGGIALATATLAPRLWKRLHGLSKWDMPPPPASGGRMSQQEALDILGLPPDASREDIVAAHRRLMQKMHPDRGGSDYLAGKINQARKTLLAD